MVLLSGCGKITVVDFGAKDMVAAVSPDEF